jgi:hypothetical protein
MKFFRLLFWLLTFLRRNRHREVPRTTSIFPVFVILHLELKTTKDLLIFSSSFFDLKFAIALLLIALIALIELVQQMLVSNYQL